MLLRIVANWSLFLLLVLLSNYSICADDPYISKIIGIDIGSTSACVGVFKHDRIEIIPNEISSNFTPLQFNIHQSNWYTHPDYTERPNKDQERYSLTQNQGTNFEELLKPYCQVIYPNEGITASFLAKLKDTAISFLGQNITGALIAVPTYLSDQQRQSIKNAGTIVGLKVTKIIYKSTAAALAYGLHWSHGETNVLVIHLGRKTCEVSLMTNENGVFDVIATESDTHLGGDDFTERIVNYFIKLYKEKLGNDVSQDTSLVQKLRFAVEKAKRILSLKEEATIEIESFDNGTFFREVLSRDLFDKLNDELFRKTMEVVEKVLENSQIKISDVNDIIMVGGSSNIPKIKQLVRQRFKGKELYSGINPDEVVAYGAAVQAGKGTLITEFYVCGYEPTTRHGIYQYDYEYVEKEYDDE